MTAKKTAPKSKFIIWNDDLDDVATSQFFSTIEIAKKEAQEFSEDYQYSIYECRLVAEEVGRSIIWKTHK